ncbi:MAG: hypothetical protein H6623_03675 [Bdellovibrionaceae bacterium]|nr:hypothetical protein [Pseudobdellovibrionaceae bacterium]
MCLFALLAGCTDIKTDWTDRANPDDSNNPGLEVAVVSKTTAIADGFSELTLTLKVQDHVGNPAVNTNVLLDKTVESGINSLVCTVTDVNGISICKIRAHRDGIKDLSVTGKNQIVQVEFTRSFDASASLFDIVGGGHSVVSAGADTVWGVAGRKVDKPLIEQSSSTLRSEVSVIY